MRLGVLDIGSNTGHLLVVDAHDGAAPLPAYSHKEPLRLAEHLDESGAVSRSGIDALTDFVASGPGGGRGQGLRGDARRSRRRRSATRPTPTTCSPRCASGPGSTSRCCRARTRRGSPSSPYAAGSAGPRGGWPSSTSAAARWRSPAAPTRRPTSPGRCRWERPGWRATTSPATATRRRSGRSARRSAPEIARDAGNLLRHGTPDHARRHVEDLPLAGPDLWCRPVG